MSMKNRILLQRNGRDQFGNKGSSNIVQSLPPSENDEKLRKEHALLNEVFLNKHSSNWLKLFSGHSKKDVYKILYPYGRPALSTFLKHARQFESFEVFLSYLLISDKKRGLKKLDFTEQDIKSELLPFQECGHYMVAYKGIGQISTTL